MIFRFFIGSVQEYLDRTSNVHRGFQAYFSLNEVLAVLSL